MQKRSIWMFAAAAAALGAAAIVVIYTGSLSRYLADDYCTAALQRTGGIWHVLTNNYENWSGRFSFFLAVGLLHSAGPWIARIVPGLLLVLWFFGFHVLLNFFLPAAGSQARRLFTIVGALLLPVAILGGTLDLYQSFFWLTGGVTYTLPLILFTGILSWMLAGSGQAKTIGTGVGIFLLGFLAGGFSETYVVMQTSFFLLVLGLALILREPGKRALALAGLAGSALALLLIVSAPGNEVRMGLTPDTPAMQELAWLTLRFAAAAGVKGLIRAPMLNLAVLVFAIMAGVMQTREAGDRDPVRDLRRIGLSILSGILLLMAVVFPSVFATAAYPAERALVTTQFILVMSLFLAGYFSGTFFHGLGRWEPWLAAAFLILSLTGSGQALLINQETARQMKAHSLQWDLRHQEALSGLDQGMTAIALPSLPHLGGLAELDQDPGYWLNACMAGFYGFSEVGIR